MPARKCSGFAAPSGEVEPCRFHPSVLGQPAQGKFAGRCVWCCPEELRRRLGDGQLTGLLVCALAAQAANPGAVPQLLARAPAERREDLHKMVRERLGEGAEIQKALAEAAAEASVGLEPEHGEEGRPVKAGELAEDVMDYFLDRGDYARSDPGSGGEQSEEAAARYFTWRGGLVYDIYRRMGGSRSREEVGELFDQEIDVSEYKNMVGGWMKTLLEAEGQAPGKMVLGILKHPVGRMTREKWAACLAGEVGPADEAAASEDDLARAAAPLALSDSECSQDEADDVPEFAPKRRRLCGKQPRPFAFLERFVGPGLAAAAALACASGPLRRPAARAAYPNERCAGADGRECSFSTAALGSPAAIQPSRGQRGCLFCCDERLDSLLVQQNGFQVTKTLSALQAMSPAKFEECLENLGRRHGEAFAVFVRASCARRSVGSRRRRPRPARRRSGRIY